VRPGWRGAQVFDRRVPAPTLSLGSWRRKTAWLICGTTPQTRDIQPR